MEEIASSVERFGRYANWSGSSVLGRLVLMLCVTSLSKHFIMIGVTLQSNLLPKVTKLWTLGSTSDSKGH